MIGFSTNEAQTIQTSLMEKIANNSILRLNYLGIFSDGSGTEVVSNESGEQVKDTEEKAGKR